jgi:hypothetical protein
VADCGWEVEAALVVFGAAEVSVAVGDAYSPFSEEEAEVEAAVVWAEEFITAAAELTDGAYPAELVRRFRSSRGSRSRRVRRKWEAGRRWVRKRIIESPPLFPSAAEEPGRKRDRTTACGGLPRSRRDQE